MSDFADPAASEPDDDDLVIDSELFRGYAGRRLKAAIALITLWLITLLLHSVSWGREFVGVLTGLMSLHALRVMLADPITPPAPLPSSGTVEAASTDIEPTSWPYVSLLVAAKNEEQVVGNLVEALQSSINHRS
ncbi:MAG: hypothetical protein AAFO06_19030 [Cyanobacteria bacterium J06597_16]